MPALLALLLVVWDRFSDFGRGALREVAVLKAIGWQAADILTVRLYETAIVAGLACAVGVVCAYVHVFVAGAPLLAAALLGWSAVYPVLKLTPAVNLAQALTLIALVAAPVVAASLFPAWRASVPPAAETLRRVR
jgi:ABC-type lipoprotein release transport system permease subunit